MPLKDHYRTLGITSGAALSDIKKAYRALAHQYHPDKAQANPFAESHFREIQEAYSVLSDDRKRRRYDEERYFAGLAGQKEPQLITGRWLLQQAQKLNAHMAQVDSYRMNHKALYEYVSLLLSDDHFAVLRQEQDKETERQIIYVVLEAIRHIHASYFQELSVRLRLLAGPDTDTLNIIDRETRMRRKAASIDGFLPVIVVLVALLLCVLMYCYSRKGL